MRPFIHVAVVGLLLMMAHICHGSNYWVSDPQDLVQQESVQKELKITDEQDKQVVKMQRKFQEKEREILAKDRQPAEKLADELGHLYEEQRKTMAAILSPEQSKRLKEIYYQQRGATALIDPEVSEALNLTHGQHREISSINQEMHAAMQRLITRARNPEDLLKKGDALLKSTEDKLTELLTPEQQKKWTDLQGEPFKGEIRFGPPRQQ